MSRIIETLKSLWRFLKWGATGKVQSDAKESKKK